MNALKFKLTIAYDGTQYAGWQVQRTGVGVQQRIEEALRKLFSSWPQIHSSSRTDSGVHALGMVAHFEIPKTEFRMPLAKLPLAINAHLPEDIRVVGASRCRKEFHARFDAAGKQYRYFIWNHRSANPLLRHQAWLVHSHLDLNAMREAAKLFLGEHDFTSFATLHQGKFRKLENPVRHVTRCDLRKSGRLLTFIIEGDGFLYKMCRNIAGTLVQAGQGKYTPHDVKQMLEIKDRRASGMAAPAHGLVLWKVTYRRKLPGKTPPEKSKTRRAAITA